MKRFLFCTWICLIFGFSAAFCFVDDFSKGKNEVSLGNVHLTLGSDWKLDDVEKGHEYIYELFSNDLVEIQIHQGDIQKGPVSLDLLQAQINAFISKSTPVIPLLECTKCGDFLDEDFDDEDDFDLVDSEDPLAEINNVSIRKCQINGFECLETQLSTQMLQVIYLDSIPTYKEIFVTLRVSQYNFIHQNRVYTVVLSAPENHFEIYYSQFQTILSTLKISQ
jgi:hypothetical protein